MKIEIEINDKLFEIGAKYGLEKALLFDKIIYLQLIKSSYEVFLDAFLLQLVEMMIGDRLVTIYEERYIVTSTGDSLIKEVKALTKKTNGKPIDTSGDIITDNFIKDYLNLFKDHTGKYIKKASGASIGASSSSVKDRFVRFFNRNGSSLAATMKTNNLTLSLTDVILEVTKQYLIIQEKNNNYQFARKAHFFIEKQDASRLIVSDLLGLVEEYVENPPLKANKQQFDIFNTNL